MLGPAALFAIPDLQLLLPLDLALQLQNAVEQSLGRGRAACGAHTAEASPAHVEDSGALGWVWEGQCPCCAGPPDPTPLPSCLWLHTEKGPGCGSADQTGPWVREMGRSFGPRAGRQLSFPGLGMPATLGLQPAGTQPCCPAVCWRRATGGRTRDTQLRHTGLGKGPAAQRSRDPSRVAEGATVPSAPGGRDREQAHDVCLSALQDPGDRKGPTQAGSQLGDRV